MKKTLLMLFLVLTVISCNKEESKIENKIQEITNSGTLKVTKEESKIENKIQEITSSGTLQVTKEELSINDGFILLKTFKCGEGVDCFYKIVDGKIIYTGGDVSLQKNLEVSGADVDTFKINGDLSKDKNYVYNKEKILSGADVGTFKYVGTLGGEGESYSYYGDKNSIYKTDLTTEGTYKKVDGIDGDSFEIISNNVSKDKNGVYSGFDLKKIDFKGDISSLTELQNCHGIFKTNTTVYYDLLKEIKGINSEYLKCLGTPDYGVVYYKDDKNYYCNDKMLTGLDYMNVEYVEVRKILGAYGYLKDKNLVYKDCELQKGVFPDSIKAN